VLALGVPRERIIFAHPCKRACDLRYARDVGVQVCLAAWWLQLLCCAGLIKLPRSHPR
jgi:diaminopimelate decarboxylase